MITQRSVNQISHSIIGCAIEVHKELGPCLLESIYEMCLTHLLKLNGHKVEQQKSVPIYFRGLFLESELRYDLLVDDLVVVELKTVQSFLPIHEAQILSYLKLLQKPKGVLLNFNCTNIFKEGQRTFVSEYFKHLPVE